MFVPALEHSGFRAIIVCLSIALLVGCESTDPEVCLDLDGDGYGEGILCAGPDCDEGDEACFEGLCCPDCDDFDGDGFGDGPDCLGPDCTEDDAGCWEGDCCDCLPPDCDPWAFRSPAALGGAAIDVA